MSHPVCIAAFYSFHKVSDREAFREIAKRSGSALDLKGSLLVANEGINGTLCGEEEKLDAFLSEVQGYFGITLTIKKSRAEAEPFYKFKVRLKKEIVTFGKPDVDPNAQVGEYVKPKDWNALISDDDVIVIDTRNDYEIKAGTFEGALNPKTHSFTQFADYVSDTLSDKKQKKIAMFCTGGIRCEKATSYLLNEGFEKVFHLEGGILNYFADVPKEESKWQGECFVFDHRVTVNHDLEPGRFEMCHVCGWPLEDADREHVNYEEGVSCEHCFGLRSDDDRARARERQKQIELAQSRGQKHVGTQKGTE